MATKKSQRIAIWVIAGTMLLGTVGSFIAMVIAPSNAAKDRAALESAQKAYQTAVETYTKDIKQKYHALVLSQRPRVAAFDAASVSELQTEDIKVGEGPEVTSNTRLSVFYIGWNPSGKVFDQSIEGETLKTPFVIEGPARAGVIQGWREGLIGMKLGGIRELTIPAAMAYGEAGQGEDIPANTPLKFVVVAVEPSPELPKIIKDQYRRMYGYEF